MLEKFTILYVEDEIELKNLISSVKANVEIMGYDTEDLEDNTIKESLKASLKKVTDGISRKVQKIHQEWE